MLRPSSSPLKILSSLSKAQNVRQICRTPPASSSTTLKRGEKGSPKPNPNPNAEDEEGPYSSGNKTHFGFSTVSEKEKASKVRSVFENVADSYDVMNDAMSCGVHRVWKDMFIHRLAPSPKLRLIDVAGGTGDIAFRFLKWRKSTPQNFPRQFGPSSSVLGALRDLPGEGKLPESEGEAAAAYGESQGPPESQPNQTISRSVLVYDINPKMLEVGKKRAKTALSLGEQQRIDWMEGDAENMTRVPDASFDAYTIAYGIRNCVHIDKVLAEAHRVLRPGGRFMCLEFSHVPNPMLKWIYDQYSFQVIPAMGQVIAGDFDSYKYLVESIRKFPSQEDFKLMIENAGFRFVTYENLTFGVSSIHSGFKL